MVPTGGAALYPAYLSMIRRQRIKKIVTQSGFSLYTTSSVRNKIVFGVVSYILTEFIWAYHIYSFQY